MKKKIIIYLFLAILPFTITGCGSNKSGQTKDSNQQEESKTNKSGTPDEEDISEFS